MGEQVRPAINLPFCEPLPTVPDRRHEYRALPWDFCYNLCQCLWASRCGNHLLKTEKHVAYRAFATESGEGIVPREEQQPINGMRVRNPAGASVKRVNPEPITAKEINEELKVCEFSEDVLEIVQVSLRRSPWLPVDALSWPPL